MTVSEERREQCRRASLSRSPEQRKADAQKAAAASVKSRFGEDKDLKQLEKMERAFNGMEGGKHDQHGPDPSKVFRAAGLGEVAVARIVKRLAERAKSEVVRLRACELAAKVLRMIREDSEQNEGITVIIQALEGSAQQVNLAPPGQPPQLQQGSYQHPKPAIPGQPITIVK